MANIDSLVEKAVVGAAKSMEKQIDDELDRLNNLQDDDLEAIRKRRIAQMKKDAENRAMWKRNGHGSLIHISEKDFFARAKGTQRMVVIFSRPGSSRYAEDLKEHITKVAESHLETQFVSIDAEKAPFLCSKFNIRILPSFLMVKGGEIESVLLGLDQISPTGKFTTPGLEKRFFDLGMITDTNIGDRC